MSEQEFKIKLLEMEIEALRSILADLDENHGGYSFYSQWLKAEAIKELRNHLK